MEIGRTDQEEDIAETMVRNRGHETVMNPGMIVEFENDIGIMLIHAQGDYLRSYQWEGHRRTAQLEGGHVRYEGFLGIICSGTGDHWEAADGITRGVTREGRIYFDTEQDALAWIEDENERWNVYNNTEEIRYIVYRPDGLVARWSKKLERRQLNVALWQIVVDGRMPIDLAGGNTDAMVIRFVELSDIE